MNQSIARIVYAVVAVLALVIIALRQKKNTKEHESSQSPNLITYALMTVFVAAAAATFMPEPEKIIPTGKISQASAMLSADMSARLMANVTRPWTIEAASEKRGSLDVYVIEKVSIENLPSPDGQAPTSLKRAIVKRKDDGAPLSAILVGDHIAKQGDEVRLYFITGPTNGTGANSMFLVAVPK